MMKSQKEVAKLFPICVAYNSLLTDNLQVTTKFSSLPVINNSLTDWSNLYTAVKIFQNINNTPQDKTIA